MDSGPSPSATMATPLPLKTGLDQPTLCFSPLALTVSRTASLAPSLPSTASTATKNKQSEFPPTIKQHGLGRQAINVRCRPIFPVAPISTIVFAVALDARITHARSIDAHPREKLLGDHCRFAYSRRRAGTPRFR